MIPAGITSRSVLSSIRALQNSGLRAASSCRHYANVQQQEQSWFDIALGLPKMMQISAHSPQVISKHLGWARYSTFTTPFMLGWNSQK